MNDDEQIKIARESMNWIRLVELEHTVNDLSAVVAAYHVIMRLHGISFDGFEQIKQGVIHEREQQNKDLALKEWVNNEWVNDDDNEWVNDDDNVGH